MPPKHIQLKDSHREARINNARTAVAILMVVGLLAAHLIDLLHLAPPCATFSIALNGSAATRVRSLEKPMGLEGLSTKQADKVRVGNALAEVAAVLMQAQHDAGNLYQLEQPALSLMLEVPKMKKVLKDTGGQAFQRDACTDGAPLSLKCTAIQNNTREGDYLGRCLASFLALFAGSGAWRRPPGLSLGVSVLIFHGESNGGLDFSWVLAKRDFFCFCLVPWGLLMLFFAWKESLWGPAECRCTTSAPAPRTNSSTIAP